MKALVIFIGLLYTISCVDMQNVTEEAVATSEKMQRDEAEAVAKETKITWINSTHLIELVSYLVDQKRTSKDDVIVIDTRNSDQYNGWHEFGKDLAKNVSKEINLKSLIEAKNGHISFAHNLDSDWLDLFNQSSLNDFIEYRYGFKSKTNDSDGRVLKERTAPVILYDVDKQRLDRVKDYLTDHFELKRLYLCQIKEEEIAGLVKTSNNSSLFHREPFYDMLISPDILNNIIRPARAEGGAKISPILDYKLFDVSNDELKYHYNLNHIPSAVHLSTNDLESPPVWVRRNNTELARVLLAHGIKPNNTEMVILYGNPDPMASFRAAIIMKSMGVKNIRILNGGYQSWFDRFLILDTNKSTRRANTENIEDRVADFEKQALESQGSMNLIVDSNYIEDLVKNYELFKDQYALIDIRSYEEYIGEDTGYPDIQVKGRIPGSFWGRAGTHPNRLEDYRNPDLTMRSGLEILKMWDDLEIDYKNKHLIFYCGNGWRSSEVMYYAELMGFSKISMYDGGWYDWSAKFGQLDQQIPEENTISTNAPAKTTPNNKMNSAQRLSTALSTLFVLAQLCIINLIL